MAGDLLMSISQDERERAVFRSRRMYQTDLESNLATAEDRGKKAGIEIGRKDGIEIGKAKREAEIVADALKVNIPIDMIVQFTGLTREEIERLRKDN